MSTVAPQSSTTPVVTAPPMYFDPASACAGGGGKFLGDMKCQMNDGSVAQVLSGTDAARSPMSSIPVAPGSPEAWALATTAINFEMSGFRHDTLAGTAATPDAIATAKEGLRQWWGINNRAELLNRLSWLQYTGHRAEFDALSRQVNSMSDTSYLREKTAATLSPQQLNQLEVVRQNSRVLGNKSILAWDLIRFIALCRGGYLIGYLSEDEAWNRVMPAAARLQLTFDSFQDLAGNYLIGREFWSLQQSQLSGERYRMTYDRLVQDKASPWNMMSWNRPLNVVTPLPITAR
jgi:hypothetical protein